MRVGIIDADCLFGAMRIPNVEAMQLSAFMKKKGNTVELITEFTPSSVYGYGVVYMFQREWGNNYNSAIPKEVRECRLIVAGSVMKDYYKDCTPDYSLYVEFALSLEREGISPRGMDYFKYYSICEKETFLQNYCHDRTKVLFIDRHPLHGDGWHEVLENVKNIERVPRPFHFLNPICADDISLEMLIHLVDCNWDRRGKVFFPDDTPFEEYIEKLKMLGTRSMPSILLKCARDEDFGKCLMWADAALKSRLPVIIIVDRGNYRRGRGNSEYAVILADMVYGISEKFRTGKVRKIEYADAKKLAARMSSLGLKNEFYDFLECWYKRMNNYKRTVN